MAMCKFGIEKKIAEALTMVRRSVEGALEAVWVSIGGCTYHLSAIRVCLAQWRHKGMGQAFYRLGRKIIHRGADLNAWADASRVDPSKKDRG